MMTATTRITVEATINAPVAEVWKSWNAPEDIVKWNTPDPSWHTPSSENDLRVGGKLKIGWKPKMAVLDLTLKVFTMAWSCLRRDRSIMIP